jgi:outer membrane protein assembly factor BamE (lipoprotein component of BamABCDE complex)
MVNHLKKIFSILMLVLTAGTGCSVTQQQLKQDPSNAIRTYQEFVSQAAFPYEASAERKDRILNSYTKISADMSQQQVTTIMGTPDFSENLYSNESPGEVLSSIWTYYLSKPDPRRADLKRDRRIEIYFGREGQVQQVFHANVESPIN